jgi:hypothetical protein
MEIRKCFCDHCGKEIKILSSSSSGHQEEVEVGYEKTITIMPDPNFQYKAQFCKKCYQIFDEFYNEMGNKYYNALRHFLGKVFKEGNDEYRRYDKEATKRIS